MLASLRYRFQPCCMLASVCAFNPIANDFLFVSAAHFAAFVISHDTNRVGESGHADLCATVICCCAT